MNDQAVVDLSDINLAFGSHASREEGMGLLEAVAYVAGQPHTDHPRCVCPVLAAFGRAWNDGLNHEDRQRLLRPFIPRLIGTRSTVEVQERRAYMATDWAVRVVAPAWLRAAGLDDEAGALEALSPLTSVEACLNAAPTIAQVQEAALAAGAAASPAGLAAARAGGVYAAWDAAGAAAGAGAGDAAVSAVRAAARTAARTAAMTALRPHVEQLQASAVDLFERMIEAQCP